MTTAATWFVFIITAFEMTTARARCPFGRRLVPDQSLISHHPAHARITHVASTSPIHASHPMLTPPLHYSIVACPLTPSSNADEVLYRGSIPVRRNIAFLDRLRIRTLLYLRKKELGQDDPMSVWAALRGVDLRWVKAERMSEEKLGMGKSEVGEVMRTILDRSAYPLYIADIDGISHTTLVVACLRKMQGWHIDSIIGEMCRCVDHLKSTRASLTAALSPNTRTTPLCPSSRPT